MEVISDNIRFMVIEVTKQVEGTLKALENPTAETVARVQNRDDYVDNLKSVIESDCFSRIHGRGKGPEQTNHLHAAHIVANNLERVGDHAVNIVGQLAYLSDPNFLARYDYPAFFEEVFQALNLVHEALFKRNMSKAFRICRSEFNLDLLYKKEFDRILGELSSGRETGNLVTTHLIFRYLERMGDALLNIGEAVIYSITGDKFKIHQYEGLREALSSAGLEIPISSVEFQSIWGTRSGCRIGHVNQGGRDSQGVIFKEGNPAKLRKEKENMERWEEIMPGLPPRVEAFREQEDSVSLLVEYLGGCNLQEVVLSADAELVENAMFLVRQVSRELWESTLRRREAPQDYMDQLASRLGDVFRLYPGLERGPAGMGHVEIPSLHQLIDGVRQKTAHVRAPFTVFIHGDYNLNNIIYSNEEQRIHYIDLHRSRDGDYLQDVSVFLVSGFRLPVMDPGIRGKIALSVRHFLEHARGFAADHRDETFEVRLAMGVARSLMTSARFEMNKEFAKSMFLRGVYLLERLSGLGPRQLAGYRFPGAVLDI